MAQARMAGAVIVEPAEDNFLRRLRRLLPGIRTVICGGPAWDLAESRPRGRREPRRKGISLNRIPAKC